MIEQMDTNMVKPESDQDIDLMPRNQEVTPPASPNPEAEQVPSDRGDTKILEDNPEVKMHNISLTSHNTELCGRVECLLRMSTYLLCNLKNE